MFASAAAQLLQENMRHTGCNIMCQGNILSKCTWDEGLWKMQGDLNVMYVTLTEVRVTGDSRGAEISVTPALEDEVMDEGGQGLWTLL